MSDLLRLAELRERATAGKWGFQPSTREHKDAGVTAEGGGWIAASDNHNSPFIAAAGNLTPERLRQLAAMEEALQRIRDWPENSASGCVQIAREALTTKGPTNE